MSEYSNLKLCFMLRTFGYPQQGAAYYWSVNEKKIYPADRIHKFHGWEKLYVAAPTDPEINQLLPAKLDGSNLTIVRDKSALWSAGYPLQIPPSKGDRGMTSYGSTEIEAKCLLLKRLIQLKKIKL